MAAHYDFDAMKLNVNQCVLALQGNAGSLRKAFKWEESPQGRDYWLKQMNNGLEIDAIGTLKYLIEQKNHLDFEALRRNGY